MTRGPGRPPEGRPVKVRIPDELLDALDAAATLAGVSRAEMVRRVLADRYRP